ncbi:chemotaxis protein CheA [Thioalkalivibrio denitrificans]|uniref:Chemotaxis protein CheA n=1 Tax=Thioalkalivibrio denitrificans TaxID=108003 RepID=A0A1V3NN76_9GAMM|nr:chemotaxis protein CheA [Thioalkalivibrio denitrificans]OOG26206.1 chemotaxis protein CheA [Thioalkalivibrio denitrificans]
MSLDTEDEILQDFLVEAGELLDALSEQLVELERNPDDRDLLNAVFRSFHTIKGGAGFLNLNNLVAVCHRAEDVFNVLRQGQRQVDSTLMDAVLQVLDVVIRMFNEVRGGEEPGPADPQLLTLLESLAMPDDGSGSQPAPRAAEPAPAPAAGEPVPAPAESKQDSGDITDEEFEALLDAMQAGGTHPALPTKPAASASTGAPVPDKSEGEITEDEFESLLDELHGKGAAPGNGATSDAPTAKASGGSGNADIITEDEFENLLDELHGKGQAPKEAPVSVSGAGAEPARAGASIPAVAAKASPAPSPPAETSVRVDTRRLDDIMNLVGELVLVRNRLATLRSKLGDEQVAKAVSNLDVVTADLQSAVMKTRMQPIKKVFGRFPRVVRDLARSLNKEINLELRGEETDLDKNLVEALADPLVHLVRNAVDHGIESPEEREKAGKPRTGHVVLSAEQEGDHILLTISDDGKGMNPDVLRAKAVEKGLMDEDAAARMSDQDAYNVIFMAGFSTKAEISDVSGRGVGMDVVKTRIAQLNGSVEIDSTLGQGSVLRIKVPLTLAILPTLMVVLGEQRFALPLSNVSEIFDLDLSRTNRVDDQEVVMVRNQALPLYYLRRWLAPNAPPVEDKATQHVVMVFVGNRRVGLVVDSLIGQEEVVIKPLGSTLHGLPGFAGATITGDGGIALILDVPGLLRTYAKRF